MTMTMMVTMMVTMMMMVMMVKDDNGGKCNGEWSTAGARVAAHSRRHHCHHYHEKDYHYDHDHDHHDGNNGRTLTSESGWMDEQSILLAQQSGDHSRGAFRPLLVNYKTTTRSLVDH